MANKNRKLIVLDHRSRQVNIYPYPQQEDLDIDFEPEQFMHEGEYVIHDDCHYMIVDELQINYHNEE